MCNPGFDLILQDTVFWPGALLGELLDIPIVEVLPLPIMTHKEYEMSFPNPLAYAPQMGLGYTVQMVLTKSSNLLSMIAYVYVHAWHTCQLQLSCITCACRLSSLCLQSSAHDKHKPKQIGLMCCCRISGSVFGITSSGSFCSRCNDQLWLMWLHLPERQDNICASMMRGCLHLLPL